MTYLISIIAIFIAYLCGSIPVGYLIARLYGIDVTSSGSGRTGGTNVLRAAGPLAAGGTVLGDIIKGLLPVFFLVSAGFPALTIALAATATVVGHNHSIFLGFRGGVGAGTAAGSLAGFGFWIGLLSGISGVIALSITGYASILSSTIAVMGLVILTISAFLGYTPYEYIITGILNICVMFYALRPNFARLRDGTERKVGKKSDPSPEAS